jgi:tetratricopeptide (TPR) repeat protein
MGHDDESADPPANAADAHPAAHSADAHPPASAGDAHLPASAGDAHPPAAAGDANRTVRPSGGVYDWYRRGMDLLSRGEAAAAAQVLAHAAAAEPGSHSIREALSRAQFDSGRYAEARDSFRTLVEANPNDDYAHFGLGLAAQRLGDLATAAEHLALAAAMRPDNRHYGEALRGVRATRRAQRDSQP